MPPKLLLINPSNTRRKGFTNDDSTRFMPVGLGIVAALTPRNWDVELLDESFEEFSYKSADLVAFTGFTANAPRAYEIAAIYRGKGIHTVMGGIHASLYTNEVSDFVDTVFTGEAEGAWPQLILDFEAGKIKDRYDGGIVNIHTVPHVRRDIYKYPYVYDLISTTRGCPIGCEFCSVTQFCGKTYREREVDDILDELESTTRPLIFFVDDNFIQNTKKSHERSIRLFKGMVERKLKKYWVCQATVNFADNDEVLFWARKSGCTLVFVGIEAENTNALKDVRKNLNLKRGVQSYTDTFKKAHKHGIGILAFMIFGMESDSEADLFARRNYILRTSIDAYQCAIMTPLPGTVLFDRLKSQNRIVLNNYPEDWQEYDCHVATINTPKLDHLKIDKTMREIWLSLYHKEVIRKKMFRTLLNTRSFRTAYWAYAANHNYGRMFLERFFSSAPGGINPGLEWNSLGRSCYLRLTDVIIWLFYRFSWGNLVKRINRKY
jgi:radical SAM superfamily enzyme YgiQ (UPF0313 family)